MKNWYSFISLFIAILFITESASAWSPDKPETTLKASQNKQPDVNGPKAFLKNVGQVIDTDGRFREDVLYTFGNGSVRLFLSAERISYVFAEATLPDVENTRMTETLRRADVPEVRSYRMDMELIGSNPNPAILPEGPDEGYVNYYTGNAASGLANVRMYSRIVYKNVYPNIDLVLYARDAGLKYDFVVKPGGNVADIRFRYIGADEVSLLNGGAMRIVNPLGEIQEGSPVSFQSGDPNANTSDVPLISSRFVTKDGVVSFDIPVYDTSKPLVIDPSLQWSTYYGGSNFDRGSAVTTDVAGNVYVAGYTFSTNFPTTAGTFQTTHAGNMDAFLIKFDAAGARQWATYFGGSNNDPAYGIAINTSGEIYIVGETQSSNLPVTAGAFQTVFGGLSDAYIAKFTNAGTRLWASFVGGAGDDNATSVALDGFGVPYITGGTKSNNFPITAGAFQPTYSGLGDAFIIKMTATGARTWATYYGGTGEESGQGIALDAADNLAITGPTLSTNLPITGGAFQLAPYGSNDGFVLKMDATGARLWATYYGGTLNDVPLGIAFDNLGNILFSGVTNSTDFPVSNNGYRIFSGGGEDAFLVKMAPGGSRVWATYYGGALDDGSYAVGTDAAGNVAITGRTYSPNFPISSGALQVSNAGAPDAFIVKFYPSGNRIWGTYFGGNSLEAAYSVSIQYSGNVVFCGWTASTNFPVTGGAFQSVNAGGFDAFVTKICDVKPLIAASGPTNMCPGATVTLDAGPGYASYQWYRNGSPIATSQSILVSLAGAYVVSVVDGIGCFGTADTVHVNIAPPLTADAGPDLAICMKDTVMIGIPAIGGAVPLTYAWWPKAGLNDSTVEQPLASPTTTTKYYVRFKDDY